MVRLPRAGVLYARPPPGVSIFSLVVAPTVLPLGFGASVRKGDASDVDESETDEILEGARLTVWIGRFSIWGTVAGVAYALVLRLAEVLP
jgi:hypothetical protein